MHELVRQYFQNVNVYLPFLHRPTMEKLVEDKLYLTNDSFASVLLLICAVASRYTEDPRVFLENVDSPHSRGWKWFDQVQLVRKSLLSPPSLYDLQTYCVGLPIPIMSRNVSYDQLHFLAVCPVPRRNVRPSSMLDDGWDRYTASTSAPVLSH